MQFFFTDSLDPKSIIRFIAGPRLWVPRSSYPDYMDWLAKVHLELDSGVKRALSCYSGRNLVGTALYQRHKTIPTFLEVKNITIDPGISRRFVASFLVRNIEAEAMGKFTHAICDAKKDNIAIRNFLMSNKYNAVANMDLYGLNAGTDTIYLKELK